jgi:hypothetical protein
MQSLMLPASGATDTDTDPLAFKPTITTVWERCSESGWFFLGELNKYVSISPVRFQTVSCDDLGSIGNRCGHGGRGSGTNGHIPQLRGHVQVIAIPDEGIAHVWFGTSTSLDQHGEHYTTRVSHEPK